MSKHVELSAVQTLQVATDSAPPYEGNWPYLTIYTGQIM
jgi:hypothetical protein